MRLKGNGDECALALTADLYIAAFANGEKEWFVFKRQCFQRRRYWISRTTTRACWGRVVLNWQRHSSWAGSPPSR
ncbi:hypothetical protein PVAP13_9NG207646 [Panicum virgatum]|uniref:Uncharacterized protein n=1 Tax=Panicum virgatum TaxID=38727 RepID=A0A8T0MJT5_PANVG|nr:hypothetical protein PVAP13_9NG207646 [Panicum virgatum]